MAFGYLNIPFESIVLRYDDEKTPLELTGKKMLPIAEFEGKTLNESLDIIALVDKNHTFQLSSTFIRHGIEEINMLLGKLGENIHNLAMPHWIWTPEFTPESRQYFLKKKEQKRGPFSELVKNRTKFEEKLNQDLQSLTRELRPFYRSEHFGIYDILIAAHLWGLYVVPEFQLSSELHNYLQKIKTLTHFDYQKDFWS